ncbi:MAG: hypothetical protein KDD09_20880 [Phaeodactylibacter sp.]|nr:hypothetical protein [Phaeodactylibacter sp.]
MFEKIIVDQDLLPLREMASRGDIQGMFDLATHTITGDKTPCSAETTLALCNAIMAHEDFGKDLSLARYTLSLAAQTAHRLFEDGSISWEEAAETIREMARSVLMSTADIPAEDWDLDQLQSCIEWLIQDQQGRMEQGGN